MYSMQDEKLQRISHYQRYTQWASAGFPPKIQNPFKKIGSNQGTPCFSVRLVYQ